MERKLKRLLLSDLLVNSTKTQKIAYIGIMTALLVVCNMFFEIKFADIQFSLTITICSLAGILIGPIFGFCACFLGDLVGFLYNSGGFAYMPWIGVAMGVVALISGFIVNGINLKYKGELYVKILIIAVLTFILCTVIINTIPFWILYGKGVPFFTYLFSRLFIKGQIWNSLFNYALMMIIFPQILRLKPFRRKD